MAMPTTHNPDNYTLGRGIGYFDKKDNVTGLHEGERDLGDMSEVTFNISIEELEHYSHRGGLKAKDASAVLGTDMTFQFVLDEPAPENMALNVFGNVERISQVAGEFTSAVAVTKQDRWFLLDKREIGVYKLAYKTGTVAFTVGETVSGATGSGTIEKIIVTSGTPGGGDEAGYLVLSGVTTGFVADEAITDTATAPGAAVAAAVETVDETDLFVSDGSATYDKDTDYTIDHGVGRIYIVNGGGIADGTNLTTIKGYAAATEYTRIDALRTTQFEGHFRFISDNPVGRNWELYCPRVQFKPSGDTALIGESWGTLSITGTVLRDETKTEGSQYMDVIAHD